MDEREILVKDEDQGKRLDVFLAQMFPAIFSRSQVKKLIEQGGVRVAGRGEVAAHYKIKGDERIEIEWPEKDSGDTRAENIPIHVLAEDEDVILVNKPAGMVVHPAHGNPYHTLVNALLFHVRGLSAVGGPVRPGIVHRLDKDTSGIMIIAKNDYAHGFLAKQFKNHTIQRVYRVAVRGIVQHDEGICEEAVGRAFLNRRKVVIRPSGGRDAETHFRVLRRFAKATLLEVKPITGRTHQIRVHMGHIGHPVLGDMLYGVATPGIARQAVHAISLDFEHPGDKKRRHVECPLPQDFEQLMSFLAAERA